MLLLNRIYTLQQHSSNCNIVSQNLRYVHENTENTQKSQSRQKEAINASIKSRSLIHVIKTWAHILVTNSRRLRNITLRQQNYSVTSAVGFSRQDIHDPFTKQSNPTSIEVENIFH